MIERTDDSNSQKKTDTINDRHDAMTDDRYDRNRGQRGKHQMTTTTEQWSNYDNSKDKTVATDKRRTETI